LCKAVDAGYVDESEQGVNQDSGFLAAVEAMMDGLAPTTWTHEHVEDVERAVGGAS
jgi:hypothetical protein